MPPAAPETLLAALPKAELHLHLEGAIQPATAVELAARQGISVDPEEVAARYQYHDFSSFLEAYKWVTTLLRAPADYALATQRLAEELLRQNVLYAEVTLSVGVMLRRGQDVAANFHALRQAGEKVRAKGLRLAWIFDAVRQFGPGQAMEVARLAVEMKPAGVVAFGIGGDELSLPAASFREAYEFAATSGQHRLIHAGEIGGPEAVREALEIGAERIGHGIAAMHSAALAEKLVESHIALEVCPTSNLQTGALARQLGLPAARIEDHPLALLVERGLDVVLSSDDPAMFHTTLNAEYALGLRLGLSPHQMASIARKSFARAFLPPDERQALLAVFDRKRNELGLV
jgi:adenosine deaminase